MSLLQRSVLRLVWSLGFAVAAWPIPSAGAVAPAPDFAQPLPAIAALAAEQHLPLTGIDPFSEKPELRAGDFVTVLFTLTQGDTHRQWLAEFRAVELTAAERSAPAIENRTMYTSTGQKFEFTSHLAALDLQMFGPVEPNQPAATAARKQQAHLLVRADFLSAGFNRFCEIVLRLPEARRGFPYLISNTPFPSARIARDKSIADANGLLTDDERAIAALGPALDEYLQIAEHTPGLKELVFTVADLPAIWRWLTGGQTGFYFDSSQMAQLDGAAWGLPGTPVYRAPFTYWLNGTHAMKGVFFFAVPKPPLLTCAGIVALQVESPKHPEKRLELRVLTARRAQ
jgi:hypothetical protein